MSGNAEEAVGTNQKRDREEEAADAPQEGPEKRARVEPAPGTGNEEPLDDTEPAGASGEQKEPADGPEAAVPVESSKGEEEPVDEPKKVGYKVFKDGKEAAQYYRGLLSNLTKGQNLNEYEFNMVMELIKCGHPDPGSKLGSGVKSIQVRVHESGVTSCFYLLRTDGSVEDFSTWKCIKSLFPAFGNSRDAAQAEKDSGGGGRSGRGRGRARGRGGGRRGRGGRGGRRSGRR